jgi:hypothetical protein
MKHVSEMLANAHADAMFFSNLCGDTIDKSAIPTWCAWNGFNYPVSPLFARL